MSPSAITTSTSRTRNRRGVIVTNTPDVLTESVADFTWALILAVTRRLSEGERLLRRGGWKGWAFDFMLGTELRGKQLGIVGFGRIGQAVAARASVFGMRVAYAARRDAGVAGAEFMSIDRLLNSSDVVSLHVPLSSDTRHLIDKRAIARMKRSAYLINTARGPVVDEEALAWALQQHLLAGAALDVYENEPAVHPDLLQLENVLLVPHLGSGTTETRLAMASLAVDNVVEVFERPPAADAGRRMTAAVDTVMRQLARAMDGLELPAVEKISEGAAGESVPRPDRHAAVGPYAGCDDAGGVDASVQGRGEPRARWRR